MHVHTRTRSHTRVHTRARARMRAHRHKHKQKHTHMHAHARTALTVGGDDGDAPECHACLLGPLMVGHCALRPPVHLMCRCVARIESVGRCTATAFHAAVGHPLERLATQRQAAPFATLCTVTQRAGLCAQRLNGQEIVHSDCKDRAITKLSRCSSAPSSSQSTTLVPNLEPSTHAGSCHCGSLLCA